MRVNQRSQGPFVLSLPSYVLPNCRRGTSVLTPPGRLYGGEKGR